MTAELILVHSPLVGPFTWTMVADDLRRRGWTVQTPSISQLESPTVPYWHSHVRSAVDDIDNRSADLSAALVAHSGAGVLLPHIGRELGRPVEAYLFVDAGLPRDGQPRMAGPFGDVLRELYSRGERYPNWTDDALREVLPDPQVRSRILDDLRPQPFEFWEETIPEIAEWPDAHRAYLQFSPAYDDDATAAERMGWPVRRVPAGHFHMLVEPDAVAMAMLELLGELGIDGRENP